MINAQLVPYGLTLGQQQVNPLSPPGLLQAGGVGMAPQVPTGEVETKYGPTTEYKTPSAGTRAAMGEAEAAGDAEVEAKRLQQEAAVKQEQMEAGGLAAQARIAGEQAAALADLKKRQSEWAAAEEARRTAELDEFKKNSKATTLFEDMTPLRRMLSAIAVGAGAWAGTMSGTGRNGAYEIFKENEDNWRRTKEAELKGRIEKMTAAGKSAKDRMELFDKEHDLIQKTFAARSDYALKALKSLKATVPTAGAKIDEEIAKLEKDNAINDRNFKTNFDTTTREQGTSTQTSSGNKNPTDPAIHETADQRTMALYAANMRREIKKMKELPPISEEGLRKYQDNETQMYAAAEEAKSLGGAAKVVALRRLDALTRSKFEGVSEDDAVAINGMESANEAFRRVLSGANIQEKEKADLLSQNQIQPGDSPRLREAKLQRMDEITEDFMTLSGNAGKRLSEATAVRPAAGKVGSPNRVRGIPAAKQDAAIAGADDYVAIKDAVTSKKAQLTPEEQNDMKEVLQALKKDPTDAEAARYLRQLRQRKGI